MKHYMIRVVYVVLLCLSLAVSAQTGTITGRVADAETNDGLPGASVYLKGTSHGVATDIKGEFKLYNVREGEVTLVVTFIGFESQEVPVRVVRGETAVSSIMLKPAVIGLAEVTVRGSLEGQQKALNQQRTADNIKNIVSADLISRFPDLNVAEALQRVPGVNISRSRGEGSTIALRGTPKHFTTININGEQIPSTQESGSRNESLDLIPADQLSSMEVTKAITPDMDGDAIGGSVNLRTPTARNTSLSAKAELGGGYNSLSQGYNGIGRLRFDQRFLDSDKVDNGRLGVMLGFSYFGTDNEEDSYEAAWSPFGDTPVRSLGADTVVLENSEYRDLMNQRRRYGATATVDYKFNATSNIIFNFMYSRRSDEDVRNRRQGFLNESAGVQWLSLDSIAGTELRRDILVQESFSENYSYNLQGEHTLGKALFDWGGFYSTSTREWSGYGGRFERGAANRINLVTTTPAGIYAELPDYRTMDERQDFFDPFLIHEVNRYELEGSTLKADNIVGKANVRIPYQLGSAQAYIKTGVKYRVQRNEKNRLNQVFNYSDPNQVLNRRAAFASVVGNFEDEDFMDGRVRFGPSIDPAAFREFIDDNERLFVFDAIRSARNSYNDTYTAEETITSGYVMTRVEWARWMLLGGVRVEANTVDYEAFEVNNITGVFRPVADGTDYTQVLPNIHARYKIDNLTNLRAAVTYSYARPNFSDIVPYLRIDEDGSNIQAGNPELEASRSLNVDLIFEKYLQNVCIVSLGGFYKNIDKFQFNRRLQFLRPGDPFFEQFPGFSFLQTQNGDNATVYGVELNTQVALDFLPGVLRYFGTYFNYTYTRSDAFTADRNDIKLPGQADHTFNAALTFDYKAFTARVSANYNGEFLEGVAGEERNDIVQRDRLQIDVNASLKFRKYWRVFAEFMNVTNAPSIRYQGIEQRTAAFSYFGWWNRFGISFTL